MSSFGELAALLQGLGPAQALTFGIPRGGEGRVLSRAALACHGSLPGITTRTRDRFVWPDGPGILMLDCDPEAVHKGTAYPGEHAAIIDRALWDRVHAIIQQSPRTRASRTRAQTPALLKGLHFGPDGVAFSPTHTRKRDRLYRYYISQAVLKHGRDSCPIGRVPAGEIENAVINQLRAVFRQPEIVVGTWRAARERDDGITEAEVRDALRQLDPLWDELFPAEQARIVQLLVERVEITEDGLDIRFRTDGLVGLVREFGVDARAAA